MISNVVLSIEMDHQQGLPETAETIAKLVQNQLDFELRDFAGESVGITITVVSAAVLKVVNTDDPDNEDVVMEITPDARVLAMVRRALEVA